jgi:hypothetical protein
LIAAITGGRLFGRPTTLAELRDLLGATRVERSSPMSAPGWLFAPLPVMISAPCAESATNRNAKSSISVSVSRFSAFNTSGRCTRRTVTAPRLSACRFLYSERNVVVMWIPRVEGDGGRSRRSRWRRSLAPTPDGHKTVALSILVLGARESIGTRSPATRDGGLLVPPSWRS